MALAPARPAASAIRRRYNGKPFLGMIDAVVVAVPAGFAFDGAIAAEHANAAWLWMVRDLAADLIDIEAIDDSPASAAALDSLMPELLARARKALDEAKGSADLTRRIKTQLGGEESWARLPIILNALRCRPVIDKAQSFGRVANGLADEAALAQALQSMPLQDQAVASLLMMSAVGQVAVPSRLVTASIRIAGSAEERDLIRAGFGPMVDAMLAHAQDQLPSLGQVGTFGDMDLICRSIDRFHRLLRGLTSYVELGRGSRWSGIIGALTKAASERIEPRLRNVAPDLNKALRKREGADRVDGDQILAAMNGIYLLETVRDSRDSLAVNTLFDQVWTQTGQALEIHIERHLDGLRRNPADQMSSARLDAALKMAEIRFNAEYAETMRRAKDVAVRRS